MFNTYIHPKALGYIKKVLESTFLSEGEIVAKFEKQLAYDLNLLNPVALNSGTSALHLAMVLAGIKKGDEVICSTQTFIASAMVVKQQGAKPVFADINYNTGNIDPISIQTKITHKTKAIIVVHWGGMPCDMDEINAIAKKNNLIVIEDAAHALGATYKNLHIGTISEYTCFSFQATKHITTGDGGAICLKTHSKVSEALTRRWFGIDRANSKFSILGEREYDITTLGFKYHLNDYSAALGLANLSNFLPRLKKIKKIAQFYYEELKNVDGVKLWHNPSDRESAYWLFGIHVENRIDFIKALTNKKICTSIVHKGIDHNTIFGGIDKSLINQLKFNKTQIHIPIHFGIGQEQAQHIVDTIKKGW